MDYHTINHYAEESLEGMSDINQKAEVILKAITQRRQSGTLMRFDRLTEQECRAVCQLFYDGRGAGKLDVYAYWEGDVFRGHLLHYATNGIPQYRTCWPGTGWGSTYRCPKQIRELALANGGK